MSVTNPSKLDASIHKPYGIVRIDQPADNSHHHHAHQRCDRKALQQHRQGETPPAQHRITAEQPAQEGVKQQREQQPATLSLQMAPTDRPSIKRQPENETKNQQLTKPIEQQRTSRSASADHASESAPVANITISRLPQHQGRIRAFRDTSQKEWDMK